MNTTPEQRAEQHGHAEAEAFMNLMKSAKTQAGRILLLHALLVDLAQSEHAQAALAGFAVAVLPRLESALDIK